MPAYRFVAALLALVLSGSALADTASTDARFTALYEREWAWRQ